MALASKLSSTSDQTVCLTDIMATVAAITGSELPHDAAEDSFNMLPVLEGKRHGISDSSLFAHPKPFAGAAHAFDSSRSLEVYRPSAAPAETTTTRAS
jgi:hypothetical protein